MKKSIIAFSALALLLVMSCKKNDSNPSTNLNSWFFKGTTDTVSTCTGVSGTLTATSSTGGATSTLTVSFAGAAFPSAGGTFTVSPTATLTSQVGILLYSGNNNYQATGGSGSNQKVTVTVSSAGKVTVAGSGIELQNLNNPADSSALTFNVTQQ